MGSVFNYIIVLAVFNEVVNVFRSLQLFTDPLVKLNYLPPPSPPRLITS